MLDLRGRLQHLLSSMNPASKSPILYQMYAVYSKSGECNPDTTDREKEVQDYISAIGELENTNKELMGILQEFNVKYGNLLKNYNILQKNEEIARNNLFESHSKWISFSREIIGLTHESLRVIDNLSVGEKNRRKTIGKYQKEGDKLRKFLELQHRRFDNPKSRCICI
jgi:hypothetical protein